MSTVKECNYKSVALALHVHCTGVDPIVCGGTRGTYVRVLVERSSGFREYKLAREEERRQTGHRAGRIVTQRLATRVDYQ